MLPLSLPPVVPPRALRVFPGRHPLVPAFAVAIAGILAVDFDAIRVVAAGAFAMTTVLALFRPARLPALALFGCFLLFSCIHAARLAAIDSFPLALALGSGEEVPVSGRGVVISGPGASVPSLQVRSLAIGEIETRCRHTLPVRLRGVREAGPYGSEILFSGVVRPLDPARAPGGFDAARFYFRSSGSLGRLSVDPGDRWEATGRNLGSPLVRSAHAMRAWMENALTHGTSEADRPHVGVILAMVLGAREKTPEEWEDSFRASGTMHLFAVSGLHVGIVAGLFLGMTTLLGIPIRRAVLIVIPLILFYALVTGLRPSAIRAALMLSIALSGFALLQRATLLNSLALAGLVLLAFDSQQVFLPGFQLSFAVLFSICLLVGPLEKAIHSPFAIDPFLPRRLAGPWRRGIDAGAHGFAASVAISTSSWIGSALPLLWHFGGISLVGIAANCIMVTLASGIVTIAAVSVISFGLSLSWVTACFNQLNLGLTACLTSLAGWFASAPGAYTHVGLPGETRAAAPLELHVMGTGGEGSVLLTNREKTGRLRHWLIDSGGLSTYRGQVLPLLRSQGVDRLDVLVLSHGDAGHIGAAPLVLTHFRPGFLLETPLPNRARNYSAIESAAERLRIARGTLEAGQAIPLDDSAEVRILYPEKHDLHSLADDRTLVARVEQGPWRFLLTFDAGFLVENELLSRGLDLRADVWIRGQHTTTPTGSAAFLDEIRPRVIVTSHGEFPVHERLAESFLERVRARDIDLIELDRHGMTTLRANDESLRIEPFLSPADRLTLRPTRDSGLPRAE